MNQTIVRKFGGMSMGDAEAISQVADIIKTEERPQVAVVSAVGGVTDLLDRLGETGAREEDFKQLLDEIHRRHDDIISALQINVDLERFWGNINRILEGVGCLREITPLVKDDLLSTGERISSEILTALLNKEGINAERINARDLISTDNNHGEAAVDFEKSGEQIRSRLRELLKEGVVPVVTGFIGQARDGKISTLGRGGSDYSASIIASELDQDTETDVEELQIWTHVNGVYNVNPDIVSDDKSGHPNLGEQVEVIPRLSYEEASELASFGAKVLHPKTIAPNVERDIPVRVLNTFNPSEDGTLITKDGEESIKAITYRKGVSILNVHTTRMLGATGFIEKIGEVLRRHGIVADVISTSEVNVSLTIDRKIPELALNELNEFSNTEVKPNMAIVCLVGDGIGTRPGVLGKLFNSINGTNVYMVSQGASQSNVTFVVDEENADFVVNNSFAAFFDTPPRIHEEQRCEIYK